MERSRPGSASTPEPAAISTQDRDDDGGGLRLVGFSPLALAVISFSLRPCMAERAWPGAPFSGSAKARPCSRIRSPTESRNSPSQSDRETPAFSAERRARFRALSADLLAASFCCSQGLSEGFLLGALSPFGLLERGLEALSPFGLLEREKPLERSLLESPPFRLLERERPLEGLKGVRFRPASLRSRRGPRGRGRESLLLPDAWPCPACAGAEPCAAP